MGCGRVGASLARALEHNGDQVSVIDLHHEAFRRLGPEFQGRTIVGAGYDRDVLIKAGIKQADGFAALSSGDNSNIIAARVVREEFGVANVVARIYDPARAALYQQLGIPTIAPVRWAAAQAMSHLRPDATPDWKDLAIPVWPSERQASARPEGSPMRIAIVGAGNVGRSIARELIENGHDVLLIEHDSRAVQSESVPEAEWLLADGCELDALDEADLGSCDVSVAATGDDNVNLVHALLAKTEFGVPRTVARINYPNNEWLFTDKWGVDVAVSTPRIMTALVEEALVATS